MVDRAGCLIYAPERNKAPGLYVWTKLFQEARHEHELSFIYTDTPDFRSRKIE